MGFEVNGKEVEPEAGSVQVQFELGAGLLPETADTSTLAVQHLTDGKAETVADAGAVTAGDVTVKNEVVKADFAVQSFSTFTITWGNSIKLTVFYVDEYGNDISATQGNVTINDNNMGTINLQQYAQTIPGYTYKNARYKSYNGKVITHLKPSKYAHGLYTKREIQFLNNETEVATVSNSNWDWDTTKATIYLVYEEAENSGGGTGGVVTKPTPSYSKQANLRDNGTYDLSLTVSSNVGSASNPAKVDVIYVLDYSGSMKESIGSNKSKITAANNAIKSMTESLANDSLINARFSLVKFSGRASGYFSDIGSYQDEPHNDANIQCGWTNDASKLVSSLPNNPSGGTNYQAGLLKANELLGKARSGATTVVIFVSDGNPTYYYGNDGYTEGDGSNYDSDAMRAAQNEVKKLAATYFFKVGVGKNTNDYNKLKLITGNNDSAYDDSLHAGTKTKPVFEGTDTKTLNAAFEEMRGAITSISCTAVNITDTLRSDYAQIVKKADGSLTALRIVVTDGDVKEVKSGEGSVTLPATTTNEANVSTISAVYDDTSKQIKLNFNPAYQLEENWTYAVIANIEPTAQAYEDYCKNKGYLDGEIGEAGTGIHARESGFYCNTDAVLTYDDGESSKTAYYAKPVIQVKSGALEITKSFSGLDKEQITGLKDKMTFTIVRDGKTEPQTVNLKDFEPNSNGTYTYVMPYCVPGATYTVTESGMAVDDFDCVTTVNGKTGRSDSATIVKGETETIAFTNVYTLSTQDLTITKAVSGADDAFGLNVSGIDYTFTITPGEDVTVKDGKYGNATFSNNKGTVTIKGERSVTIPGLPVGTYTVRENSGSDVPEGYDFDSSTDTTGEAVLTSNKAGQVTITNKYKIKTFNVTVKKEVTGNMGDTNKKFSFTHNGTPFELQDKGTEVFTDVKYGTEFTVSENDYSNDGYTTSYKVNNGDETDGHACTTTVTAPTTITFTNTKTIQPPNGITTTIAPYAIMVVLAAGAGVYFVYSRRRRNR